VAGVPCDIVRADLDGAQSYLLHGDRSYGQYLFDAVLDAGEELGMGVAGYPEAEI
jgi:glycine cleavage system aminomethyltransferase T